MKELPHENDLEAHYFGATSEVALSAYFSLFLVLLLLAVLLSNKVAHHWHSQYVPEAAAVITLGIVAGIGCRLWPSMIAHTVHSPASQQYSKRLITHQPLFLPPSQLMAFDAKTFFVVLLPPIIFNSGTTSSRSARLRFLIFIRKRSRTRFSLSLCLHLCSARKATR